MKRTKTVAMVLCSVLLCFAATAMATEFSFYDSVNDWIVTAYSEENDGSSPVTYSVYVNILDPNTNLRVDPALVLLTKTGERQDPASNGDYLICNCAVHDQISLAYKSAGGLSDIFVMDHHFDDAQPPQEYVKVHNTIQLTGFDLPDPANISVSGSGSFGTVNVGSSSTNYITVSNTGEETLTLTSITVTGTSFSREGGSCGSTVAGGGSCTIGVKFQPAGATAYSGDLQIISNDGDTPTSTVALTGTGVAVQTGNIDITYPAWGALSAPTSVENGQIFSLGVKIVNNGADASGAFVVKLYFSVDSTPGNSGDTLLGTWNVSSINPGQTLTYTFSNLVVTGKTIHMSYNLITVADANSNVAETNEANNIARRAIAISR